MAGATLEIRLNYVDSNLTGSLRLLVQRHSMSQKAHHVSLNPEKSVRGAKAKTFRS